MTPWDLVPFVLLLVKLLLIIVAVVFFISGLDDVFVDVVFAVRALYRRVFVTPRIRPLSLESLMAKREQPVAIMIPAWRESDVIAQMLTNLVETAVYRNYRVFVGTYPNDPDTQREVLKVRKFHPRVQLVVGPRPGPTCKADSLNAVYRAILDDERYRGMRYDVFVMQDAEDWPHPLSLRLFNYLLPRKDMVQLPVYPLPTRWNDFTSGHYIDEFAESHLKNMVVREALSGSVPSAGVGCAFTRRALQRLAEAHGGQVFNTGSLTEDYEVGFRLHVMGMSQAFVRAAVARPAARARSRNPSAKPRVVPDPIAVRAYFPTRFGAAVKQKARWVLGITLQGYCNLGWTGRFWTDYMLFRDRKSLLTSIANVLGYLSLAAVLSVWVAGRFLPDAYRYPPLVTRGSWLYYLIVVDTAFLAMRVVQRAFCTYWCYGLAQAALSVPRLIWGNFINFGAAIRAVWLYASSRITGRALAWGKTAHTFPSAGELRAFRRRLGELLIDNGVITIAQLTVALERQQREYRPLGEILVRMGAIKPEHLASVLGNQRVVLFTPRRLEVQ